MIFYPYERARVQQSHSETFRCAPPLPILIWKRELHVCKCKFWYFWHRGDQLYLLSGNKECILRTTRHPDDNTKLISCWAAARSYSSSSWSITSIVCNTQTQRDRCRQSRSTSTQLLAEQEPSLWFILLMKRPKTTCKHLFCFFHTRKSLAHVHGLSLNWRKKSYYSSYHLYLWVEREYRGGRLCKRRITA